MTRLTAWIGIALAASYLVFVGGAGAGIYTADLRILTVGAAAIALGAWAWVAWRRPEWRPRSAMMPAILAGLASLAIATVTSRYPRISAEYLAFGVVLAALYLLLVRLMSRPFFRHRLVRLGSTLFLVIAVAYVAMVSIRWIDWWTVLGRFAIPPLRPEFESLTFGNPSNALMMAAILAVPALASARWNTRRGAAWVITVLALLAVVALLSGSRAGWLALAFAGVVGIAALAIVARGRWSIRSIGDRLGTTRARVIVGTAGAAAIVLVTLLAPAILRRVSEGGEQLRLSYLAMAGRMFGEAPITGTGLGSWVVQRIRYTEPPETDYYIPHAHNIYAQTLAEQGLVGAVAGIVLLASLGLLIRNAMRDPDPTRRQWGLLTLGGLAYFGAHETLDIEVNLPAVLLALAIPVAYLDATVRGALPDGGPNQPARTRARFAPALGGLVVALALVGLVAQEIPARTADRAVALANAGDWAAARGPALEAAAADPAIGSYRFAAGLVEARAGNHEASASYFRSVAEEVDLPEAWINLAAEEHALGHLDAASSAIRSALRLGYQRAAVSMAAGDLALRMGDEATAVGAFTAAVSGTPSLAEDPWWAEDSARASALRAVLVAVAARVPGVRWEVALMTGDGALAASLAPGGATGDFIAAWQGDTAALTRLDAACTEQPIDIQLLLFCARAHSRAGDVDRANDFRYLANAQIGGAYSFGAELRVATRPMEGRTLEGSPAIFWGTYTYRRPTPWDILVPSLVHLTLE